LTDHIEAVQDKRLYYNIQEKAFDSLECTFILTTLKHFGFNESFIIWVKTLYSNIQTCVMNNGWISEIFKNSRGIRQGCPLSALLFVLSVEIMALLKLFLNAVLEHKKEVLNQHLKEK
jgi:hypothetical protein